MVSVVTVHSDPGDFVPQMESLAAVVEADPVSQVVVVENGQLGLRGLPVPPTVAPLLEWVTFDRVRALSTTYNAGLAATKREWLLIVAGDVLPPPGFATAGREWLEDHQAYAQLGGDWWFGELPEARAFRTRPTARVAEIVSAMRCGLFITNLGVCRRSLFDTVRFDESGWLGQEGHCGEDNDLGMQIRARGYQIGMVQTIREEAGGPEGKFWYVHRGLRATVRRMAQKGADFARARAFRIDQLDRKWRGGDWRWEREDGYVRPGAYSAVGLEETVSGQCRLPAHVWRAWAASPDEATAW